jgi:urease accessory protein
MFRSIPMRSHPVRAAATAAALQGTVARSLANHRSVALVLLMLAALPAAAHTADGVAGGFISGFLHPVAGWDHVIAMVAVGLWGAFLGRPAVWLLPVVFPLVMAVGGALGVVGVPLPGVEVGIALSAGGAGRDGGAGRGPPLAVAAVIVGVFAIFHGHAHGTELPQSASPIAYSLGFVIATGLLHAVGIGFSLLGRWPLGQHLVRAGGGAIAALGAWFLVRALS